MLVECQPDLVQGYVGVRQQAAQAVDHRGGRHRRGGVQVTPHLRPRTCKHMHVCIYVCMYTYVYVCMHICMYVCIYVCMHVCMYALRKYDSSTTNVCMYACMKVCMYVHVCMCVCVYVLQECILFVYIYVCMYVCMYVSDK